MDKEPTKSPEVPMSPEEQMAHEAKKKHVTMLIWFVVTALLIAGSFMVGMFVSEMFYNVKDVVDDVAVDVVDVIDDGEVVDDGEVNDDVDVVGEQHELHISWFSFENQTPGYLNPIFAERYSDSLIEDLSAGWQVGTVQDGEYEGWGLWYERAALSGLGTFNNVVYTLRPQENLGSIVILDRYAAGIGSLTNYAKYQSFRDVYGKAGLAEIDGRLVIDTGARIPEFDHDTMITDNDGNNYAFLGVGVRQAYDESIHGPAVSIFAEGPPMYMDSDTHSFTSRQVDGVILRYDYVPPFWQSPGEQVSSVDITYYDTGLETDTYLKASSGGCGYGTLMNVVDSKEIGGIQAVGTAAGETIYESANYNLDLHGDAYKSWQFRQPGGTFEEFANAHAFFYWENPFGDYVQFTSIDVSPPAECGKPVIYLYPEETMDIDVTVAPEGGFSITIPDYNDGWSVTASPNGELVNKADGVAYPYLFWEGNGGLYSAPERNWVMAQSEVEPFLYKTLYQLGLNKEESFDFMEFWYPRMQDAPYYKIGFHGTRVMDELAPLSVSGDPETIIRVLMDFEELDEPVKSNPPNLPDRPARDGFTVIEWGGVLVH